MATGFEDHSFRDPLGKGERRRSAAFPSRIRKQGLLFLALIMTVSTATPQTPSSIQRPIQTPVPPVAKKVPKEIVTHGDRRLDDYFWLREKTNAEVIAYLEAENAYGDAVTRPQQPFRERLYGEMLGHLQETDSSAPVRRGEFFYYTRTEKGKSYPIYCRKRGSLKAPEEIILDQNALAEGHKFFSLGAFVPSDDNRLLAYTTDSTGYRRSEERRGGKGR